MSTKTTQPAISLPIIAQQTDTHCGAATLQLLFSFVKKNFSQDQIAAAAGISEHIKKHGMQPEHMPKAIRKLAPHHQFWFKQHATDKDIDILVNKYHYPVAVNWQGFFYDTFEEEEKDRVKDDDYGHYSVVVDINRVKDSITIADTYRELALEPRTFSIHWFINRWHDTFEKIDKKKGVKRVVNTKEFIFIITPKSATFPKKLGMQLPNQLHRLTVETKLTLFEKLFAKSTVVGEYAKEQK